jgi:hypothetical protein
MTFGIFVATFSSMYVASPVLLYIERRFPRTEGDKGHVSARAARQVSMAEGGRSSPEAATAPMKGGKPAKGAKAPPTKESDRTPAKR